MSKSNPRVKNGAARRKLRARLRKEERPCALCGRAIDYSLPAGHPWSFEVDEIIPVSRGGSPFSYENVQPVHRTCNQKKGNKILPTLKKRETHKLKTSRDWTK